MSLANTLPFFDGLKPGDDSLGGSGPHSLSFYAVNGWNDIEFVTPDKTVDFEGKRDSVEMSFTLRFPELD